MTVVDYNKRLLDWKLFYPSICMLYIIIGCRYVGSHCIVKLLMSIIHFLTSTLRQIHTIIVFLSFGAQMHTKIIITMHACMEFYEPENIILTNKIENDECHYRNKIHSL